VYSSPRMIKLRRIRWSGHVAFHGCGEKLTGSLFGRWILQKKDLKILTGLNVIRMPSSGEIL
jgi:hypothetical protein